MGRWFANFLATNGYKVTLTDQDESTARRFANANGHRFQQDLTKAIRTSQLIVFATPTHVTNELLENVASHTSDQTLLLEISSIKAPVRRTIEALKRRRVKIMSIHPMFGPGATSLSGRSIILVEQPSNNATAKKLISIFRKRGARVIRSSLKTHDKLVATTLSLPHLINIAFLETLKRTGLPLDALREIGGTTFNLQLLIAESLYHENLNNEASILADNRHCSEVYATFIQQANRLRGNFSEKYRNELFTRLRKDSAYVRKDPYFRAAYQRFAAAIEAAVV